MNDTSRSEAVRLELTEDGRASVAGPLTFESVPELFLELDRRVKDGARLQTFDLAGVTAADSAGLALLLEWQARGRDRNRGITVRNAPGGLLRLARLCEADEVLDMSGREDNA